MGLMPMFLRTIRFGRPSQRRSFTTSDDFVFHEPGRLRDGELELLSPSPAWIDAVLASAEHPTTVEKSPDLATLTRRQLNDFLARCPGGRQHGDASAGVCPAYHFWMYNHDQPNLPIAGAVGLRMNNGCDLDIYYGHFGYHVYPAHRGRHFAERSVRLLLPLAAKLEMNPLWITCNPENWASRRTCLRLGAELVETVVVPRDHALFARGETTKCRYRLTL
jgi:tagatose 1,6-diphosphate aldolase